MNQLPRAADAVSWRAEGGDLPMTDDERGTWALFRWRLISPLLDPACTRTDRREDLAFLQAHPPQDPRGTPLGAERAHART